MRGRWHLPYADDGVDDENEKDDERLDECLHALLACHIRGGEGDGGVRRMPSSPAPRGEGGVGRVGVRRGRRRIPDLTCLRAMA